MGFGVVKLNQKFAILCVLIATLSFTLNDALVKLLSQDLPLHQIVFIRTVIALVLIIIFVVPLDGGLNRLKTNRPFLHMARGIAIVVANATFFAGLVVLPIGTAVAVFFIAPMLITSFSALILKEQVNIYRWGALLLGFIGVLLIVQPGTSMFDWFYVFPILAAVFYAITNTLTRHVGLSESASSLSFYIQITFLFVSTMVGVILGDGRFYDSSHHPTIGFFTKEWIVPTEPKLFFYLGLGGVCATVGTYFIAQAYRLGEAGLVTPFEYSALIYAVFWGFLFWHEIPDILSGFGMLLIFGSGVFALLLEEKPDVRIGLARLIRIYTRKKL